MFQLDHTNFAKFFDEHALSLNEFYAPWCGHCQQVRAKREEPADGCAGWLRWRWRCCCCCSRSCCSPFTPPTQLAPNFREAAAKIAAADLPKPVAFAKMNDGAEANRVLRAGKRCAYIRISAADSLRSFLLFTLK